ncbi:MAG TPA: hypothetical protein GXX42_13850 [Petrimonas sp.]|uniref:hypothetical protein n=1 Tax=Petrimonas sp. TaxID=2023866 RepID=UPI001755B235|nr:hypothetical protein [Petrimonas sp.]
MTNNLSYPFIFTGLGFLINSLVDKGERITTETMYKHIENRTVWNLLEEKLGNRWLSLWNDVQRNEMMDYFASSANAIDAEDKYGVVNNGYCLLVAYLFEAGQGGEKSGWFPSLKK